MSKRMRRIPLKERIEREKMQEPDFLRIFNLYTEDYFTALSRISRAPYFAERYRMLIRDMEGDIPLSLAKLIHGASKMPSGDREFLLYSILVEPFTCISGWERS